MAVALIFPGQGAQAVGMGVAWRATPAWELAATAESLGIDATHLLLEATPDELGRTRNSQLSVLLASLMAWESLRPELDGEPIVAFAGHSLGQVTALIAAGALSLEDGLRLALRRAEATQAAADATPGRMAALLGATPEQADAAVADIAGCWVANDNAPGQVVIAGTPEGLEAGAQAARDLGVRKVMSLDVGGAFHTPLMSSAADDLRPVLGELPFADTAVPVVSNTDAAAYVDGAGWTDRLAVHLVEPVRWRSSMDTLAGLATSWIEVGPGASLAAMAKRGRPDVSVRNVSTPDHLHRDLLEAR